MGPLFSVNEDSPNNNKTGPTHNSDCDDQWEEGEYEGWQRRPEVYLWGHCHCCGHRQRWIRRQQPACEWVSSYQFETECMERCRQRHDRFAPEDREIRRLVVDTGGTSNKWVRRENLSDGERRLDEVNWRSRFEAWDMALRECREHDMAEAIIRKKSKSGWQPSSALADGCRTVAPWSSVYWQNFLATRRLPQILEWPSMSEPTGDSPALEATEESIVVGGAENGWRRLPAIGVGCRPVGHRNNGWPITGAVVVPVVKKRRSDEVVNPSTGWGCNWRTSMRTLFGPNAATMTKCENYTWCIFCVADSWGDDIARSSGDWGAIWTRAEP